MSYSRSFSQVLVRFVTLAVLVGALVLAGCGGGSDTQSTTADKFALASAPIPIEAAVVSITKVGETRISRTTFDYTYSITVRNGPKAVTALTATLTSVGVGTTILDGVVDVGALAAGATVTPVKKVKIRHDRTFAFNPSAFQWSFVGTLDIPMIFGRLADGYIRGAIVFWDCNNNLKLDLGETSTITKEGGQYTIEYAPFPTCRLSADIPSNAIDEDTNAPVSGSMFLRALDSNPNFISPLTTIVSVGIIGESELNSKFGPGSTLTIASDYVAAGVAGIPYHSAAKYTAAILQSQQDSVINNGANVVAQIQGLVQQIPASAYSSTTVATTSEISAFKATIPNDSDYPRITSDYALYEINSVKYATLNLTQKIDVDHAYQIYLANRARITFGETVYWSELLYGDRKDLKTRFTTNFQDSQEVLNKITERKAFIEIQSAKIKAALENFKQSKFSDLVEGSSSVFVDGLTSATEIIAGARVANAAKGLIAPQKSSTVRRLKDSLAKVKVGAGCMTGHAALFATTIDNLNSGQVVDVESLLDAFACIADVLKDPKHTTTIKTVVTAIKAKNLISALDRTALASLVATVDLALATADLAGVGNAPGADKVVGTIRFLNAILKSIELSIQMSNTEDAASLAFDKALADIGVLTDEYLRNYAVEVFDLRIQPYFNKIPSYSISIGPSTLQPLENTLSGSLVVAPHIPISPAVQWFFGDGSTKMGMQTTHIYSLPGKYTVTVFAQANTELAIKVFETVVEVACPSGTTFSGAEGCVENERSIGWCGQTLDFFNNSNAGPPPGWAANLIRNGPGIVGGQLLATATDGGIMLDSSAITMPSDIKSIVVEYDNYRTASGSGQFNNVEFRTNAGLRWRFDDLVYSSIGAGNRAFRSGLYTVPFFSYVSGPTSHFVDQIVPLGQGLFKTRLTARDRNVEWVVTNLGTNIATTVSRTLPDSFRIADIVGTGITAYETTGGSTWIDNVKIQCLR